MLRRQDAASKGVDSTFVVAVTLGVWSVAFKLAQLQVRQEAEKKSRGNAIKSLEDKMVAAIKSLKDELVAANKSLKDELVAANKLLKDELLAANKSLKDELLAANKSLKDELLAALKEESKSVKAELINDAECKASRRQ